MNVASKVVLIVFGALVGHYFTVLFPQSENWAISLWNHNVLFLFPLHSELSIITLFE
jgi:hypothetical protein